MNPLLLTFIICSKYKNFTLVVKYKDNRGSNLPSKKKGRNNNKRKKLPTESLPFNQNSQAYNMALTFGPVI